MRASFAIAIGISAIDALLCAFTAVTVLALVIVSPTTVPGGSLADDITMIEVQKRADGAGLSTKLLLDIQGPGNGQVLQLASAPRFVLKNDPTNAGLFSSSAGAIEWADSTCGEKQCTSHITVTAARGPWKARFRAAGDASAEIGSEEIRLVIRTLPQPGQACDRKLSVTSPVGFTIKFGADAGISC
ncbi:hypothetical protein ACFPN2_26275 [Steroidobacter flavus]|uniref:Uncharacterized protein n=1 Tax=Steroidobacter flavus TaxID=1842136 RepID=A0ABV8T0D0_9GAMM